MLMRRSKSGTYIVDDAGTRFTGSLAPEILESLRPDLVLQPGDGPIEVAGRFERVVELIEQRDKLAAVVQRIAKLDCECHVEWAADSGFDGCVVCQSRHAIGAREGRASVTRTQEFDAEHVKCQRRLATLLAAAKKVELWLANSRDAAIDSQCPRVALSDAIVYAESDT